MKTTIRAFFIAAGLCLIGLPAIAETADDYDWPEIISFGTPSQGSSGHVAATIIADAIRTHTDVRQVVVEPFGNAGALVRPLANGDVEFGFHGGFRPLTDAYYGVGDQEPQNIRNVMMFAMDPWAVLVTDPEIKDFGDLKGRTMALLVNNADHVNVVDAYLELYDMTRDDIDILPVTSIGSAYQWLRDGRADAFPFGMAPALQEVKQARGLWGLPVTDEEADYIIEREPTRVRYTLKAGSTVLAPEEDLSIFGLPLGIAVNADVDDELVYQVVKLIFEVAQEDLFNAKSNSDRNWNIDAVADVFTFPMHDGMVRYLQDQGKWSDEMAERQKALMR